jgi:hypothetical protein
MQMKAMRKSRLGLAIGAALGAATLVPATSFGWSVNTTDGALNTSSGGDTLLFPVYTTAVGASSSYSVTNTSAADTVVAKIRFREQVHSMDVLDFVVVLSPNDKYDFYVDQRGTPTPVMHWTDQTCVVGPAQNTVQPPAEATQPFPDESQNAFVDTNEQMAVGHLEVLGMAVLNDTYVNSKGQAVPQGTPGGISLADAALHDPDTGAPADCNILTTTLTNAKNVNSLNSSGSLADVPNVLVGRYVIDNGFTGPDGILHEGIEGGSDAVAIQDSNLTTNQQTGNIQITSQTNALCTTSRNCIYSEYAWDKRDWDHPHLGEMENLTNFQTALTAANVSGDWSNNPEAYVGVDWVVSFPDKYSYLDYISAEDCDGGSSSKVWCLLYNTKEATGQAGIWTTDPGEGYLGTENLCLPTQGIEAYNTEEKPSSALVTVSPGLGTSLDLCNELTVMTVAGTGQDVRDSVIQRNATATDTDLQMAISRQVVRFDNLTAPRGWASLPLNWAGDTPGGAITGILFTVRATSNPLDENGSITELQKDVNQ